ncbi:MAG: hypothetical protein JWM59_212 [Verrucomicrobiales bacterium]|nr:hypothetical protein [Verrucomicrobiales bacterium]
MQDQKRAFPAGPPASQGGDAVRNARVGGGGVNPGFPALSVAVGTGAVRRRMGTAPPRPLLTPVRTWWTLLADAGSLMALCGIVCGGPLLVGMVWLPWAKHVIASKYTAQFRDGLPYATWPGEFPDPAQEHGQGQGPDRVTELNNCRRIQLHKRSIFTPPPIPDARTLTDRMGAIP